MPSYGRSHSSSSSSSRYGHRSNSKRSSRSYKSSKRSGNYDGQVFRTKRSTATTVTILDSPFQGYGYSWSFAGVTGYSEFQAVFDSYRITGVEMSWFPEANSAQVAVGSATAVLPLMYIAPDYNDATAPATADVLLEHEDLMMKRVDEKWRIFVKPRAQIAMYSGGVFTGYMESKVPQWISTSSPSVLHYGLKWATRSAEPGTGSAIMRGTMIAKYYLEFKNVTH